MGMNFPSPAIPGQIYAPPGGPVYRYDDPTWTAVAGAGGAMTGVPEAPTDGTQYGRQSAAWTPVTGGGGGGSMTAAEILTAIKTVDGAGSGLDADLLDGQSSAAFAVASHTHAYSSLTSIPSTFAPSAHSHPQSEVTSLVTDLGLKAPLASPALTGTPTAPTAAPATNTTQVATTAFVTVAVSGATGGTITEAPNDGKPYARKSLGWDDLTDDFAAKAATSHTHAYSSLTSIPSTFAPSAHSHPQSEVTNLVTDLAGKAPTVHTHAQADVTNLTTDLTARVLKAGDTMTGNLTISPAGAGIVTVSPTSGAAQLIAASTNGHASLFLDKGIAGSLSYIDGKMATKNRWRLFLGDGTAESGSNNGSHFVINRYDDAGTTATTSLSINRVNGIVAMAEGATTVTQPSTTNTTLIATTAFVKSNLAVKVTVASSAPGSPATNDVWIDTT